MAKKEHPKPAVNIGSSGTYIAYDRSGAEIWTEKDFVVGSSQVPRGISITMGAGVLVSPDSGERIHKWDPWGVLA